MTVWSLSAFYFASRNRGEERTKLLHVGYMNKTFGSKSQAIEYYNAHNPHLRPLQSDSERSDWDPDTKLAYVPVPYPPHGQLLRAW